jgi:hypothetical protein
LILKHTGYWWGSQKERDHWEGHDVGKVKGKVIPVQAVEALRVVGG